jgi:hypothetical protein
MSAMPLQRRIQSCTSSNHLQPIGVAIEGNSKSPPLAASDLARKHSCAGRVSRWRKLNVASRIANPLQLSLVPQSVHRIDPRRTTRGKKARQRGHNKNNGDDAEENFRISGAHLK